MRDNETTGRRGGRGSGERRGGRFGDRTRKGSREERPRGFRKGSSDNADRPNRRDGDRTKKISRDGQGKNTRRGDDKKPRDLDSELMNYWVKSGKGQDPGTYLINSEGKNVAQQKLNEDLDNYWKARGVEEKVEEKPQQP